MPFEKLTATDILLESINHADASMSFSVLNDQNVRKVLAQPEFDKYVFGELDAADNCRLYYRYENDGARLVIGRQIGSTTLMANACRTLMGAVLALLIEDGVDELDMRTQIFCSIRSDSVYEYYEVGESVPPEVMKQYYKFDDTQQPLLPPK